FGVLRGLIVVAFRFRLHFSLPTAAGLFSGATTNTPSLAAGQAALLDRKGLPPGSSDLLGMAYAVAYPFGVVGIILTMLLIKKTFRVDPKKTRDEQDLAAELDSPIPVYVDLEVTNPNCDGIAIRNLPFMAESGIVFSRLLRNGKVIVPEDDSVIHICYSLRLVSLNAKLA